MRDFISFHFQSVTQGRNRIEMSVYICIYALQALESGPPTCLLSARSFTIPLCVYINPVF